jgi:hypothetical protein
MPKGSVETPITDDELVFAHLPAERAKGLPEGT